MGDFVSDGGRAASAWHLAGRLTDGSVSPVAVTVAGRALLVFHVAGEDTVRVVPEACPSCGASRGDPGAWDPVTDRVRCPSCGTAEGADPEGCGHPVMCVDDEVYVHVEPEGHTPS